MIVGRFSLVLECGVKIAEGMREIWYTILTNHKKEKTMKKKNKEVKLNRLQMKLEVEKQIVDAIINDSGDWGDGTGKGNMVLRVYSEEHELATVHEGDVLDRYYITVPGWKMKMVISEQDLTDILDEGVAKVKEEKKQAKQKADAERQKKSKIGYMDVFKRVAEFLKKNGYTISTPKNESEPIVMKVGTSILKWNNLKDFVSAGFGVHGCWDREGYISIFNVISYWTHKYYKLAYPSLRKLVDKVKVLGEVDEQAILPVAVMDELNRLKI